LHTNRFQSAGMSAVEVPGDAVLDDRAPAAMRGKRLHDSAESRYQRLRELLGTQGPLGLEDLARLMADHGPDGRATAYTPCVHSDYWNTTTSVQLLPNSRTMRIAFAPPCVARYHDFSL
jgi:hypothetical protein